MPPLHSNITGRAFNLLQPDVGTIQVRRVLAAQGIDAGITTMLDKLDLASAVQTGEQAHGQKREGSLEEQEEVDELAERIQKELRCDDEVVLAEALWKSFDEVVWQKRGLLDGPWRFDG
ncbi:hypothetical protein LTR36_001200 [Oleoguttula mirabilis]|uniref:Uncharacterized protein n=1 Tax=Oleoguttula mirabilis TaxID=1507867 RepID=A0AAV9J2W0_9PEZI|nr:hypothetical protein LTR36_001200 [Oleoguttula mirabilis]